MASGVTACSGHHLKGAPTPGMGGGYGSSIQGYEKNPHPPLTQSVPPPDVAKRSFCEAAMRQKIALSARLSRDVEPQKGPHARA